MKKDPTELCSCKCHYGGAVSCPSCKNNHGIVCCHCKDELYLFFVLLPKANILRLASSVFSDSI